MLSLKNENKQLICSIELVWLIFFLVKIRLTFVCIWQLIYSTVKHSVQRFFQMINCTPFCCVSECFLLSVASQIPHSVQNTDHCFFPEELWYVCLWQESSEIRYSPGIFFPAEYLQQVTLICSKKLLGINFKKLI